MLISEIRSRPGRFAPVGLAILAFIVYIAHIHIRGYPGDPNLYYEAARDSHWFIRAPHFGYVALLDLSFAVFGPFTSNLYFVQGLLSAIAGAISVWLVIHITRSLSIGGLPGVGLMTGAFFAFSGGILITANYGETYMLQVAFILGATALVLRRRLLIGGLLLGWTFTFTPLSILLMPVAFAAIGLLFSTGRLTLKDLTSVSLGASAAFFLAAGLLAIYDTESFSKWTHYMSTTAFGFEGRGRARFDFVLVQFFWLARGLHIAIPLVLTGIAVVIIKRTRSGVFILVAAIVTLLINLPVMVRVDDYWRMLMIVNVYGAIFASIGLVFALGRLGLTGSKRIAASAVVLIAFSAVSLVDMPRREFAVATETRQIYTDILDIETPALVISIWDNVISAIHYARVDGRDDLPELVSFPPLQNWRPPEDARNTVAEARANGTPVYVIIRERRFDSPLMRAVVGTIDTDFATAYQSILTRFSLRRIGPLGNYHALYFADPI